MHASDVRWRRLHPIQLLFDLASIARRFLLPLLVGGAAAVQAEADLSMPLIMVASVSSVMLVCRYYAFRYALGDHELIIKDGVLARRTREIPLPRISHVETSANPIARYFGVTRLHILTEGTGAPEASLPAVSVAEAEHLARCLVSPREQQSAATERIAVFKAKPGNVFAAGATAFNLWVAVGAIALVQTNLTRLADSNVISDWLRELGQTVSPEVGSQSLVFWLMAVGLAMLGLWLLNVVLAYFRWWRFSVTRQGSELTIESGFLKRNTARIADGRIQGLLVRANGLRRLLGLAEIVVVAPRQGSTEGRRSAAVVPITDRTTLDWYLAQLWPKLINWTFCPSEAHPYHRRQQFTRYVLVLALVSAAAIAVSPVWVALAGFIGGALIAWSLACRNAARTGFELTNEFIAARTAGWGESFWIVPRQHVQALIVRETPFQRRRGLVTVDFDINGLSGRIRLPNIPHDTALTLQQAVLTTLHTRIDHHSLTPDCATYPGFEAAHSRDIPR